LLDMLAGRLGRLIIDGEDSHVGQADEQRAHARGVDRTRTPTHPTRFVVTG